MRVIFLSRINFERFLFNAIINSNSTSCSRSLKKMYARHQYTEYSTQFETKIYRSKATTRAEENERTERNDFCYMCSSSSFFYLFFICSSFWINSFTSNTVAFLRCVGCGNWAVWTHVDSVRMNDSRAQFGQRSHFIVSEFVLWISNFHIRTHRYHMSYYTMISALPPSWRHNTFFNVNKNDENASIVIEFFVPFICSLFQNGISIYCPTSACNRCSHVVAWTIKNVFRTTSRAADVAELKSILYV